MTDLEVFLAAYIEAALFSTNDESRQDGGDPLDDNYDRDDIEGATVAAMRRDCEAFLNANAEDIAGRIGEAGKDFWFNRNGHGVGFWDGDWPDEAGERLDAASVKFGEVWLFVGDDGEISQSGVVPEPVPTGKHPEGDECNKSPCDCFF